MVMNSLASSTKNIPASAPIHLKKTTTDSDKSEHQELIPAINKFEIENQNILSTNIKGSSTLNLTPKTKKLTTPLLNASSLIDQNNSIHKSTPTPTDTITKTQNFLSSNIIQQGSYSLDFLHSVGAKMAVSITRTQPSTVLNVTSTRSSVRYSDLFSSEKPTSTGRSLRSNFKFLQQSEVIEDDKNFLDLEFNYKTINEKNFNYQKPYPILSLRDKELQNYELSGNCSFASSSRYEHYSPYQTNYFEPNESFTNYRNHHYYYKKNWKNNDDNDQIKKVNSRISTNMLLSKNDHLHNLSLSQQQQHQDFQSNLKLNQSNPINCGSYQSQPILRNKSSTNQNNLNNSSRISPCLKSSLNFNNLTSLNPNEVCGNMMYTSSSNVANSNVFIEKSQYSQLNYEETSYFKQPPFIKDSTERSRESSNISMLETTKKSHIYSSIQNQNDNPINIVTAKENESDSSNTYVEDKLIQNHQNFYHPQYHHLLDRQFYGSISSSSPPIYPYNSSSPPEHFSLSSTDQPTYFEKTYPYRCGSSDYHILSNARYRNISSNAASADLVPMDSKMYVRDGNHILLMPNKRHTFSHLDNSKYFIRGRRYWYPNLRATHNNVNENNTPPDRYLAKAHLIEIKTVPKMLTNGTKFDQLSEDIWKKFVQYQQREETFRRKIQLWKVLYLTIKKNHLRYGLYMVGSTISGFGTDSSDIDMCLVYRSAFSHDSRTEALSHLNYIRNYLISLNEIFQQFHIIEAKVPILRFRDTKYMLEIDLNFNNCVGIRNTHLLYCYTQLDWRLRPLVLIVKLWAQYHHINNAKTKTISSYSLSLMVINFLQCGVQPPVLPCLHELYPEKFNIILKSNDFGYVDMIEGIGCYKSKNQQCIGELFVQFLQYYSTFDYSKYAISVRTGKLLTIDICRQAQSVKNDIHQWIELCIEEPFDLTNTARSVYDSETFDRIKNVFINSWQRIQNSLDLKQIFMPMKEWHNLTSDLNLKPSTSTVNSSTDLASNQINDIENQSINNNSNILLNSNTLFNAATSSTFSNKNS